MKLKEFYELVELQKEPEATLLPNLQYRTKKYPYFQPDIFIYIKCLYLSNSDDFSTELGRLAPFVSDRKALFYYVMNDRYKRFQKKVEKQLARNRTDVLISAFFETIEDPQSDTSLDYDPIAGANLASFDYFSFLTSGEIPPPQILSEEMGELEVDLLETEDDMIIVLDPIYVQQEQKDTPDDNDIPQMKHQNIIDRFIEKSVSEETFRIKLDPDKDDISEDELDSLDADEETSDLENDYFFTQTLANIYIKQKKYERAYEIIKHLSLNYPEKNVYFADQLSFLEKLIKNSNINK